VIDLTKPELLTIRGRPDAIVRIYAVDGTSPDTVHGAVQSPHNSQRWDAIQWGPDGCWKRQDVLSESFWDLVPRAQNECHDRLKAPT